MAGEVTAPDVYVLRGKGIFLLYQAEGDGGPVLRYSGPAFPGGEGPGSGPVDVVTDVAPLDIGIGKLLTVNLADVPDLVSFTLTLIVPEVNVGGLDPGFPVSVSGPGRHADGHSVETCVIYTAHSTSIGGPGFVRGQLQSYAVVPVRGSARRATPAAGIEEISLTRDDFLGSATR